MRKIFIITILFIGVFLFFFFTVRRDNTDVIKLYIRVNDDSLSLNDKCIAKDLLYSQILSYLKKPSKPVKVIIEADRNERLQNVLEIFFILYEDIGVNEINFTTNKDECIPLYLPPYKIISPVLFVELNCSKTTEPLYKIRDFQNHNCVFASNFQELRRNLERELNGVKYKTICMDKLILLKKGTSPAIKYGVLYDMLKVTNDVLKKQKNKDGLIILYAEENQPENKISQSIGGGPRMMLK